MAGAACGASRGSWTTVGWPYSLGQHSRRDQPGASFPRSASAMTLAGCPGVLRACLLTEGFDDRAWAAEHVERSGRHPGGRQRGRCDPAAATGRRTASSSRVRRARPVKHFLGQPGQGGQISPARRGTEQDQVGVFALVRRQPVRPGADLLAQDAEMAPSASAWPTSRWAARRFIQPTAPAAAPAVTPACHFQPRLAPNGWPSSANVPCAVNGPGPPPGPRCAWPRPAPAPSGTTPAPRPVTRPRPVPFRVDPARLPAPPAPRPCWRAPQEAGRARTFRRLLSSCLMP